MKIQIKLWLCQLVVKLWKSSPGPLCVSAFKTRTQMWMVCEKVYIYQSEDNFSINTFKVRTTVYNKPVQNKARIWLTRLCIPYGQSTYHRNMPQSEDTNFVLALEKCPHFEGVKLILVLALNAMVNALKQSQWIKLRNLDKHS